MKDFACIFIFLRMSGLVHEDLRLFLETSVPKSTKKEKVIVGVGDSKLGAAIVEELGISCQHTGVVPEIIRGTVLTCTLTFSHLRTTLIQT